MDGSILEYYIPILGFLGGVGCANRANSSPKKEPPKIQTKQTNSAFFLSVYRRCFIVHHTSYIVHLTSYILHLTFYINKAAYQLLTTSITSREADGTMSALVIVSNLECTRSTSPRLIATTHLNVEVFESVLPSKSITSRA